MSRENTPLTVDNSDVRRAFMAQYALLLETAKNPAFKAAKRNYFEENGVGIYIGADNGYSAQNGTKASIPTTALFEAHIYVPGPSILTHKHLLSIDLLDYSLETQRNVMDQDVEVRDDARTEYDIRVRVSHQVGRLFARTRRFNAHSLTRYDDYQQQRSSSNEQKSTYIDSMEQLEDFLAASQSAIVIPPVQEM